MVRLQIGTRPDRRQSIGPREYPNRFLFELAGGVSYENHNVSSPNEIIYLDFPWPRGFERGIVS